MNVASLENCKRLYELSGWDGTHIFYDAENDAVESRSALMMHPAKNCPAYDAGYLLRKLLSGAGVIRNSDTYTARRPHLFGVPENKDPLNGRTGWEADTPEDALCLLAIQLFEVGILTKEQHP